MKYIICMLCLLASTCLAQLTNTTAKLSDSKVYTISARSARGNCIGTYSQGDKISIQYVSGKWGDYPANRYPVESPDATSRVELSAKLTDVKHATLARIPKNTAVVPFVYTNQTAVTLYLCMSAGGDTQNNVGSVKYQVTKLP